MAVFLDEEPESNPFGEGTSHADGLYEQEGVSMAVDESGSEPDDEAVVEEDSNAIEEEEYEIKDHERGASPPPAIAAAPPPPLPPPPPPLPLPPAMLAATFGAAGSPFVAFEGLPFDLGRDRALSGLSESPRPPSFVGGAAAARSSSPSPFLDPRGRQGSVDISRSFDDDPCGGIGTDADLVNELGMYEADGSEHLLALPSYLDSNPPTSLPPTLVDTRRPLAPSPPPPPRADASSSP